MSMDEEEKVLKEARKLPWENRILHKNWKVRNDVYINLVALFASFTDPKDPSLRQFGPFFKKSVADSNAAVQDKALDALISYLKAADADAGRFAKEICDAVAAKCLIGRPKTVEKAQMIFMLWVELEAVEAFMDAMEKAIKNKVAKAVVPAIDVMFQALSEFGSKVVPAKRVLKMLPELFDHQDQSVRASSKGLTLELCRWIGKEPVKSILFEKMRDTMKKELEAELANVNGIARPTRKIRSEQDKEPEKETGSEVAGSGPDDCVADAPQDIDEYELVDPVDILTPLEKTRFWVGVKATKWSERKEAVAELTKLASTKRISPGDFTEICRTLKKLINDVNIAVAVEAIQAIGNLAKGLRTHFSGSARFLLPILLEKLKEKKPTFTEALSQTLQAMYKSGCLNLAEIAEEIKAAVKNKVPLVRSLTLNWVTFCIETSKKAVVTKIHKEYVPICMESLNDGTPDVRDAAFSVLAAVAKMVGMRPLEKVLEKLDDVRRKKLSEMIGSSDAGQLGTVAVKSSAGAVSLTEASEGSFVRKSAASMLSGKKHVQAAPVSKKGETVKSGVNKKGIAAGQVKAKPVVPKYIKVNKHVKDSQGTTKAIVAESCKPHGAYQETCESSKAISLESTSVSNSKGGRSGSFGVGYRKPRRGGRAVSSRAVSVKAPKTESVLPSQPVLNVKYSKKAREMDNKKEGRPRKARLVLKRSVRENGENLCSSELNMTRHSTLETSDYSISLADLIEALEFIEYGSSEQFIEGMKLVCHGLVQATSDPEGDKMEAMLKDTDRIASCLAIKVTVAFDFSLIASSSRPCKYVLNGLMQIFKNKKLSHTVKESTLDRLITELLLWFSDARVLQMDDGKQLLQFLNVLIQKILDNAERTLSIAVLNNLLRPLGPSRWPSPKSNESLATRKKRFFDLVAICLIKLSKMEKNAAVGRKPSSEPLSTLFPASKLTSSKSRLHRIPLSDANSMNKLVKTSTCSHQCEVGPKDC